MRSISPIIATILLIVIVVAMAGLTYAFLTGMFNGLLSSTSSQVNKISSDVSLLQISYVYWYDYRKNLVLDLPLDTMYFNGTYNITPDTSGYGNNGIVYNATLVPGILGNAMYFNGDNSWIDIGNSPLFNFVSGNFTILAWINTNSSFFDNEIVAKGASCSVGGYKLVTDDGYLRGSFNNQSANPYYQIVSAQAIDDGKWHFVGFEVQNLDSPDTYSYLYIDGEMAPIMYGYISSGMSVGNGPFSTVGWNTSTPDDLGVGSSDKIDPNTCNLYFDGLIEGVRIYNAALPLDIIQNLFYRIQLFIYNPSNYPINLNGTIFQIGDCTFPLIYNQTFITSTGSPIILPGQQITLKVSFIECNHLDRDTTYRICLYNRGESVCSSLYIPPS